MAGSYPDAGGRRMGWDTDGTVSYAYDAHDGTWDYRSGYHEYATAEKTEYNDEDNTEANYSGLSGGYLSSNRIYPVYVYIFPELRDLDAYFIASATDARGRVELSHMATSTNTTSGLDGTWTDIPTLQPAQRWCHPYFRTEIISTSVTGIRAVRFQKDYMAESGGNHCATHLYGNIATGETPDRLLWVDNTTGLELTELQDWGDVPRGSVHDIFVKLKNNSTTYDASNTVVDFESPYGASSTWYTIKEGAGSFLSSITITTITKSGGLSSTLTIRQTIADDEVLGLHAARAVADTGSWV